MSSISSHIPWDIAKGLPTHDSLRVSRRGAGEQGKRTEGWEQFRGGASPLRLGVLAGAKESSRQGAKPPRIHAKEGIPSFPPCAPAPLRGRQSDSRRSAGAQRKRTEGWEQCRGGVLLCVLASWREPRNPPAKAPRRKGFMRGKELLRSCPALSRHRGGIKRDSRRGAGPQGKRTEGWERCRGGVLLCVLASWREPRNPPAKAQRIHEREGMPLFPPCAPAPPREAFRFME